MVGSNIKKQYIAVIDIKQNTEYPVILQQLKSTFTVLHWQLFPWFWYMYD